MRALLVFSLGLLAAAAAAADLECQNGGIPNADKKRCVCPSEWEGNNCETFKCNGHGTPSPDQRTCQCEDHWLGEHCETTNCKNGGTPNGSSCKCVGDGTNPYWDGDICDNLINCGNGGTPNPNTQTCKCVEPWTGADCSVIECKNGGVFKAGSKRCECSAYAKDDDCGTIEKCANGGVYNVKDGTCDCPSYWNGDCSTIECVNGGYAVPLVKTDGKTRQSCHCPKGFYGIHCDAVKQARAVAGVFATKPSFNLYIHNELTDWYGQKAYQRIQESIGNISDGVYSKYNLFQSTRGGELSVKYSYTLDGFDSLVKANKAVGTHKYSCQETDIKYKELLNALKENEVEDSVILMYTQYPPLADQKDDLAELKKYLRAFRIKLNVLIGADDILLDCNSKKNKPKGLFNELADLVHFTDGEITSFLVEDETDPNEMLPAFFRSSARPQSHSRAASDSCEIGTALKFQTDPYPNTYYIAVRSEQGKVATLSGTCSSGGEIVLVSDSVYGEFSLFSILSGAKQTCELTVTKEGECVATVYSTGGDPEVDIFDLFYSFASSEDMETDSISTYIEEKFFLTLHVEVSPSPKYPIVEFKGSFIAKNEMRMEYDTGDLIKRASTFEYQSKNALKDCPDGNMTWIQLTLEGFNSEGGSLAVLNRIVPLNCEERKTPSPSGLRFLRLREESEAAVENKPMLALMYSNQLPTQQFSRYILESTDESIIKDAFGKYGFIRFDSVGSMDFDPTDNFELFKKEVYDAAPDSTGDAQDNLISNMEQLTELATKSVTSDSLVSIAIANSLTNPNIPGNGYSSNLAQLANLGARLLFWGDISTIKIKKGSDSLEAYTRMAAVSAGHLVLIDMNDFDDDDDDMPFYVSAALRDMYVSGPSQRLLAYSNVEWDKTSDTTTQYASLGKIQVPEGVDKIFVSITFNVDDPAQFASPFMASLVLDAGGTERIVYNIDDFTQYGSTTGNAKPKCNLITASIDVKGGSSYDGEITILAMVPYNSAHIRFWTNRTADDILPDLTYVDFGMRPIQPDNYLGAALHVPALNNGGDDVETMSLRFIDNNGEEEKRLDHNQTVEVIDGKAHFVPYFCNYNQSAWLSRDMYTIEITYSNGFKYFRPLLCAESTTNSEAACTQVDEVGNVYCVESNPPFHRGPSQKLIDCSGVGQVVYTTDQPSENNYKCICDKGFGGASCQESKCEADIVHLPFERDASFRTLSFVFISPSGDEACSSMAAFYAKDARALFKNAGPYENIWQYTFSVYYTDGTAKTLYRGASYEDFYKTFTKITDENNDLDTDAFCGKADNNELDMEEVFNLAVESVGRDSRGIVLLFASQSFTDEDTNRLENLVISNECYQSVQAYQQQIYMVVPTMNTNLTSLTSASGGVTVKMVDKFDGKYGGNAEFPNVFDKILKSQIGWVAVESNPEDKAKWTISQDVEIFITSDKKGDIVFPTLKYCPSGVGGGNITLTDFPSDDDDLTRSSHVSVAATTENEICIYFDTDESKRPKFTHVVILTTESPILYALIGQDQPDTDKRSAGATTSAVKGAHISFDKQTPDYTFSPQDLHWRQATRIGCTFAQEFVPQEQPFNEIGPYVVKFDVVHNTTNKDSGETQTSVKSSLAVPLAVTESIQCVNGLFNEAGSYCACVDGYSGPTCSQPSCEAPGRLNSHGDHCDCTGAEAGGLFCR